MQQLLRPALITGLAAALAMAAACSKPAPPPAPAPAPTPIQSLNRREGVWKAQILVTAPDGQRTAMAVLTCVGPSWGTVLEGSADDRKNCSAYDLERQPNGDVALHSACDWGKGGRTTANRLYQGDPQVKIVETDDAVTTGAVKASDNGEGKIQATYIWERPCKTSEKSGQVMSEKVILPAGNPTAPNDLDPAELKRWDATK